jgi:hypothetical protein
MKSLAWVAAFSVATLLVGCQSTLPEDSEFPLTRLSDVPPEPPTLVVASTSVDAVQFEWYADGEWRRQIVDDPSSIVPTPVELGEAAWLEFDLNPSGQPAQLLIQLFTELDASGRPTSPATVITCPSDPECELSNTDEGLRIRVADIDNAEMVSVLARYLKPATEASPDGSKAPLSLTASWVIQVVESTEQ